MLETDSAGNKIHRVFAACTPEAVEHDGFYEGSLLSMQHVL